MHDIAVIGAGKIGSMIADLLVRTGDYRVTVADRSGEALRQLRTALPVEVQELDVSDPDALDRLLAGKFAVLSAAPYHLTVRVAEAARRARAHYLDLTEDVASTPGAARGRTVIITRARIRPCSWASATLTV